MNSSELESKLETITNEFYSPYRFAKVLNELLSIDLPPQMIYNYVKKGYVTVTINQVGKMMISNEEARRFIVKYATKHIVTE